MDKQYQFVMNKTFREVYKQEQDLENNLAEVWGYSLHSASLDYKSKRLKQRQIPNVASITLRKFGKQIPKTQRIQQVQDSIKALHNQRKLMQEQQKAMKAALNGQQSPNTKNKLIQWMQNLVDDYNSILEHKHLMKKQGVQGDFKKLGPTQDQVNTQQIINKIEGKKKQLQNADLETQIRINRQIAKLYREFYDQDKRKKANSVLACNRTLVNSYEPTQQIKKIRSNKSMLDHPNFTSPQMFTSLKINPSPSDLTMTQQPLTLGITQVVSSMEQSKQLPKPANILKKYKESQYKKQHTKNSRLELPPSQEISRQLRATSLNRHGDRKKLQKDVLTPFGTKKQTSSYREVESKIKSNQQALQIWKGKVQEATYNSAKLIKKPKQSQKSVQKLPQKMVSQQRQEELCSMITQQVKLLDLDKLESTNNQFGLDPKATTRNHEKQKEDIFAQLLRKRNNKFNKLWGTRILVKYDAKKQAKSILRGEPEKNPNNNKSVKEHTGRSTVSHQRKVQTSRQLLPQERINKDLWIAEVNDQEHYWRTIKNQKINLLLKRH